MTTPTTATMANLVLIILVLMMAMTAGTAATRDLATEAASNLNTSSTSRSSEMVAITAGNVGGGDGCRDVATKAFDTITIRAGVIHTPPFAYGKPRRDIVDNYGTSADEEEEWKTIYGGFQPHLLERLQIFAKEQDSIHLKFDIEDGPSRYDDSINLIANDCNTTANPQPIEECQKYDMIIGDYWCSPERYNRVNFSPPWLRTTMSVMKYMHNLDQNGIPDYTTLREAFRDPSGVPVCALGGSIIVRTARRKFPNGKFLECPSIGECIEELKAGKCSLYTDDELQLHYWASTDSTLQVTNEQFNTQYLFWPISYNLDPTVDFLLRKWMYTAVQNSTMDELYREYFQAEVCPGGTAGKHCEKYCDPIHGQADKQGVCVCISTRWTGDDCSVEVLEDVNLIPRGLKFVGNTMFGLNCLFVLLCCAWLYYKRDTAQIQVSQPYFLGLVLVGCLISSSTILVLGIEDNGEDDGLVPACMAIPWLYSVGFSITFGTLFAKIRRVYRIFKSASSVRRDAVTWKETVLLTAGVLLVDVTVLTVWTVFDPLTWTRTVVVEDKFGHPLESYGQCVGWATFGSTIGALHIVLLGIASYMCYVARDIPGDFSESRYIAMAMISNFQILLIGLPVLVLVGSDPSTSYFVRSTMVWMNDFMVVALIFGNLIHSVHFSVNRNAKGDVKTMIGNAIKRYTQSRSRSSSASHLERKISGLNMSESKEEVSSHNMYTKSELEDMDDGSLESIPIRGMKQDPSITILPSIPSVGDVSSTTSTVDRTSKISEKESIVESGSGEGGNHNTKASSNESESRRISSYESEGGALPSIHEDCSSAQPSCTIVTPDDFASKELAVKPSTLPISTTITSQEAESAPAVESNGEVLLVQKNSSEPDTDLDVALSVKSNKGI